MHGTNITAPFRYAPTPYSVNWNLNLQYQLPANWLLDVGYVGSKGVQLITGGTLNQLPVSDLTLGAATLNQVVNNPFYGFITTGVLSTKTIAYRYLLAPYPQFTGVGPVNLQGANSKYHSLQVRAERRLSDNLTVQAAYTAGKMMDDSIANEVLQQTGVFQDYYNRRGEWSLSTADVSQRIVGSVVFNLPFGRTGKLGRNWSPVMNTLLGGWQMNGIITKQTGQPLSLSASNVANLFGPGERPNNNGQSATLQGAVEDRLNRYFNTSVFSQPASFTLGNVSRTLPDTRSPSSSNLDLSLFKNFRLMDVATLQFRAEAFNTFNTADFAGPNTSVSSTSFGVISAQSNSPRQIQLALKLLF